jgi:methyltransferase
MALLGLIVCQRFIELMLSRSHERWMTAHGGHHIPDDSFPAMLLLHATLLPACALEAVLFDLHFIRIWSPTWLAVLLVAQLLRYWAILTLGRRWTVRVWVMPDLEPIVRGPYRLLRHPNYLAVILEVAALPLVVGAWRVALFYSVANALVLSRRIHIEEHALGSGYAKFFASHRRFWPGPPHGAAK